MPNIRPTWKLVSHIVIILGCVMRIGPLWPDVVSYRAYHSFGMTLTFRKNQAHMAMPTLILVWRLRTLSTFSHDATQLCQCYNAPVILLSRWRQWRRWGRHHDAKHDQTTSAAGARTEEQTKSNKTQEDKEINAATRAIIISNLVGLVNVIGNFSMGVHVNRQCKISLALFKSLTLSFFH